MSTQEPAPKLQEGAFRRFLGVRDVPHLVLVQVERLGLLDQ